MLPRKAVMADFLTVGLVVNGYLVRANNHVGLWDYCGG